MGAVIAVLRAGRWLAAGHDAGLRREVRRRACRLVRSELSADGEGTAAEIAEVALLRLLWLQRATRSAARWRQVDAAALLARTAVECCIVGLYCAHEPTAVDDVNADNVKRFKSVLRPVLAGEPLSPELLDRAAAELGTERALPTLGHLAAAVLERDPQNIAGELYRRIFTPLSAFFAHSSGLALMVHTHPRSLRTRTRPWSAWSRTSAVHTVDACVGALAAALAEPDDREFFEGYSWRHWGRVITPLGVVSLQLLRRQMRVRAIPAAFVELRRLRTYVASGAAASDSAEEREARLASGLRSTMAVLGTEPPGGLIEWWTPTVAQQIVEEAARR